MKPAHDPRHEEWLREALASGPGAAQQEPPEGCPVCREQLEALRRVEEALSGAAQEQREVLAALDAHRRAPGREQVAAFVRARAQELSPPARRAARPFRRGAWLATAAAAVVGGAWLTRLLLPPRAADEQPVTLGAGAQAALSPQGEVERYGPFTWSTPLAEGEQYELSVFDARPGGAGAVVLPPTRLLERRWDGDTSAWPERVHWELRILDATGVEVRSWSAECSRKLSR